MFWPTGNESNAGDVYSLIKKERQKNRVMHNINMLQKVQLGHHFPRGINGANGGWPFRNKLLYFASYEIIALPFDVWGMLTPMFGRVPCYYGFLHYACHRLKTSKKVNRLLQSFIVAAVVGSDGNGKRNIVELGFFDTLNTSLYSGSRAYHFRTKR